jgi:hypothetical protein
VPFPNNLALDPMTGKVNLPPQACESTTAAMIRTGVLNMLDGFGTYELAMTTTFTATPDPNTLMGNVVMYKIAQDGAPVAAAGATPVPTVVQPTKTLRFDPANCASPALVDAIAVVPLVPLDQHATYVVAVKNGLMVQGGGTFFPSATWSLVRQSVDPVTVDANGNIVAENTPLDPTDPTDANGNGIPDSIEQLLGINLLWQAHAKGLQFLDAAMAITSRDDVLVAWTFNTQTTTDQLDPSVTGSPAMSAPTTPLGAFISLNQQLGLTPTQFLTATGVPCGALPCGAIGEIFGGTVNSPSYQVLGPNPLSGGAMIPGAWDDPVHPTVQTMSQQLGFIGFIPAGTAPAGGWPTVVFGHGLGSAKETLAVFAPQLAQVGFASIAIDFQAHGSRAVRNSVDPLLGCAGACSTTTTTACTKAGDCPTGETCNNGAGKPISATTTQQCFAPFLSTDLAGTRDNIRQTVLDLERLTRAIKACGTIYCKAANGTQPAFAIDPAHIVYAGISLGSILGTTTSAVVGYQSSLLNVSAVGWIDILINTPDLEIKCPVVNALIDQGILMGPKWDPAMPTVGLCTTADWFTQPGFQQFAVIARWIVDPADGANFTAKLAPRKFLLQEVVNDEVVPNIATDRQGALLGQTPKTADPYNPLVMNSASAAITTNLMTSKWVRYPTLPATDATTGNFGNLFHHASLLEPAAAPGHCVAQPATACIADAGCAGAGGGTCVFPGVLGTARVQLDAITFLVGNR